MDSFGSGDADTGTLTEVWKASKGADGSWSACWGGSMRPASGDDGVFPMPLEIEINGRVQTVAMTGGRGQIAVPAGAHVLIDPQNKVLRQMDVIDALQDYKAAQKAK